LLGAGMTYYGQPALNEQTSSIEPSPVSARSEGDRTRAVILRAAEQLFVEHGFAATSIATVARVAGVTKSLIHHHFGSKRALWDAVKGVVMEDYGRKQQQLLAEHAPNLALIEESVLSYFRFLQEHPNVVRFWNWMTIEGDREAPAVSQFLMRQGVETLRRVQAAGEMRDDIAPEYILAQLCVLMRGWFIERPILEHNLLTETNSLECDELYLSATMRVFMDGLRKR
jgi:TetR/AcrR family transcriptional regulator